MKVLFCYVLIYLVEALILWLYCNDLFIPKHSGRQTVLFLSGLYCLLFLLSLLDIYPLNAAAFLAVNFMFLSVCYDMK